MAMKSRSELLISGKWRISENPVTLRSALWEVSRIVR